MEYDLIVVGAGATGLYTALDAASRGLKVCLIDEEAPGQKTSANSSRLIHGGVRYLKQLRFGFVREGLKERALLIKNAPEFVRPLELLTPTCSWWQTFTCYVGLKIYQFLAGSYSLGPTKLLSRKQLLRRCPHLQKQSVVAGVSFFDAHFDDQELIHALLETFLANGGVFHIQKATHVLDNRVHFSDGTVFVAKGVVLALGPFTDAFLKSHFLKPTRGIHLMVDRVFHPHDFALFNMNTSDGRVFFVIPDHGQVLLGTTDIPSTSLQPTTEEIQFVLQETRKLLNLAPEEKDILKITSGLRPLSRQQKGGRDIDLVWINRYTLSVFGGKWTSSRKTAEVVVDAIVKNLHLQARPCCTQHLTIRSSQNDATFS